MEDKNQSSDNCMGNVLEPLLKEIASLKAEKVDGQIKLGGFAEEILHLRSENENLKSEVERLNGVINDQLCDCEEFDVYGTHSDSCYIVRAELHKESKGGD